MKKTLVLALAMVFVLGVAGVAFANPYSDVPAGHWAYKAINDLSKTGVLEGYPDGTFKGNQTLTRYEAAAITARALARADKADAATKATIDKLAVEFSKELNDLGVKVAKLEKQVGTWKFGGDARFRYYTNDSLGGIKDDGKDSPQRFQERVRITAQSNVNDNVIFNARFLQQNTWKKTDNTASTTANGTLSLETMKFTFKNAIGNADLVVGREPFYIGSAGLFSDSLGIDGFRVVDNSKNFKWSVGGYDASTQSGAASTSKLVANTTTGAVSTINTVTTSNALGTPGNTKAFWFVQGSYPVLPSATLTAAYVKSVNDDYKFKNYIVGAKITSGLFTLNGDYTENKDDNAIGNKKGAFARLYYKGAVPAQPGSWGIYADYRKVGESAVDGGLTTLNVLNNKIGTGVKGPGFGFDWAFTKNAKFTLDYEDLKSYDGDTDYKGFTYARAEFYF